MEINWIPVSERLPDPGDIVIAWSLTGDECVVCGYDPEHESESGWPWILEDRLETTIEVSHWMPMLPKPE